MKTLKVAEASNNDFVKIQIPALPSPAKSFIQLLFLRFLLQLETFLILCSKQT
jgi:hypothetical protein